MPNRDANITGPQTDFPPDASRAAGTQVSVNPAFTVKGTGLFDVIIKQIGDAFPLGQITPSRATTPMGVDPNNMYVSAFRGYHSVWYENWSPTCIAGWHTHVDDGIALGDAQTAFGIQLRALVAWLNTQP